MTDKGKVSSDARYKKMIGYSGSNQSPKTNPPQHSWGWLSRRFVANTQAATRLDEWFDQQLDELEQDYSALITARSRSKALQHQLRRDSGRS